jgi:hypothetical protein
MPMRREKKIFWSQKMTNLFSSRSFFTAGLRMPLHPDLTDILLKFQVQLHRLTPNAIA